MITTTILATLVAGQAQGPLPKNAAVVYSGIPGIVGAATPDVRMVSHSVTIDLAKSSATATSLTIFHNDSAKPVKVVLKLPVDTVNPVLGRGWDVDFKATLDNVPLKLSPWQEEKTIKDESLELRPGVFWTEFLRYKSVPVVFNVRATQVLRISYTVPMGKSGLTGMHRMVAYETSGALAWKPSMDRLNFTIRFGAGVVFQVVSADPKWGWQIGEKGAFAKQEPFRPEGESLVRFLFYPNGFDKIGTIGD